VDYVTTYSKMHLFTPAPDRLFVILSAGNLATTQEVINHIQRDIDYPTGAPSLTNVKYLFEAAEYVGKISQRVQQEHSNAFAKSGISGATTLLIGGQITGQPHGLIMIYPQGNYISSSPQTPYLQIGESKYGKPALDRIAHPGLSLNEGASLTLVSLDATTRSNITVGPPFEIATYQKDSMRLSCRRSFDEFDPYLINLRDSWNTGIVNVFNNLPPFEINEPQQLAPASPTTQAQAQAEQELMMKPQRQIT
jgi:putative proteasome-type protease